jgi:hypothetical protein
MTPKVLYEKRGEVAYITINRPEVITPSTLNPTSCCVTCGATSVTTRRFAWP